MEELIGAAAGGGIFGLVGTFAGKAFRIWERREEREDRRIQNSHELMLIEAQSRLRAQETEAEIVKVQTEGSYAGLTESLRNDSSFTAVSPWVNNIRALVRPALTGASLAALVTLGFFTTVDLQATVADAIVFISVTAAVWYFGDRAPRSMTNVSL